MLSKLTPKQIECMEAALTRRELAESATTLKLRAEYLVMAERWEQLARTYGYCARLDDYIVSRKSSPF